MTNVLSTATPLPAWLQAHFPYRRRVLEKTPVMHFVDEGEGVPVLMIHGNPTWSFLWRDVIAAVIERGCRAVAPDLIGLGLSEKPRSVEAHSLDAHIRWTLRVVDTLALDRFVVVGQDWGGPIAAGVAAERPDKVVGAVFANTAILLPKTPIRTTPFHRFSHLPVLSDLAFRGLLFPVPVMGRVQGDSKSIGSLERRAYRFPFRRWRDRAAPLAMARMVPDSAEHPSFDRLRPGDQWARAFEGPVRLVWGMNDPILGRALYRTHQVFDQAEVTETEAGHFLQEEVPNQLADAIVAVSQPTLDGVNR